MVAPWAACWIRPNPHETSKNREKLPLAQRHWHCDGCGEPIDRDINAAKNIKTAGLAGIACGATGSGIAA
ncbi:transposase [Halomonas salinarum]|uniref:transposase n=1 Tax=Halomonas salinarum TaxID=1158993 RepID=UPI001FD7FC07|nr:transposase [Halomonas salinarum]